MEAQLESLQHTFQSLVQAINAGTDTAPATEQFMTSVKWLEQWLTSSEARTAAGEADTALAREIEAIQRDIAQKDQLLNQADEALARWEGWLAASASSSPPPATTTTDMTF